MKTYFTTCTILKWECALESNFRKEIVISSFRHLTKHGRARILGFVIMPNHLHLIWQILEKELFMLQRDFLKFTAKQIIFDIKKNEPLFLETFKVNSIDREYQIWQRKSLSKDVFTNKFLIQKLRYIHKNPLQPHWRLSNIMVDYKYSSAAFYAGLATEWDFLVDYREVF